MKENKNRWLANKKYRVVKQSKCKKRDKFLDQRFNVLKNRYYGNNS